MMRQKTIERLVREFIGRELSLPVEKISLEDNLVTDLHADSMDIVNIVTNIESRFKIKFPDSTELRYDAYTMQFLVDGVTKALEDKSAVRRAAKTATEKAERVAKRTRAPRAKKPAEEATKPAPSQELKKE